MTNEELVALIQAGERERLPELWNQVERFVARQANRLLVVMGDRAAAYGLEFGDLYNSGYFALLDAVNLYDPTRGDSPFIGLLALCLKTAFAETGGWRTSKRDPLTKSTSMDKPIGEEDGGTVGDFIPDPAAVQAFQDVEERLYQEQLHAALERALGTLEADEEAFIRARYYQSRTLEEIGPKARTLESHALVKLRRPQVRSALEQFIEERTPYYMKVGVRTFQNTGESAVERIVFRREQLPGLSREIEQHQTRLQGSRQPGAQRL